MCDKGSILKAIEKELNDMDFNIDSECGLNRLIFIKNVNEALKNALLDLNLENCIFYMDTILGLSLKNGEESSVSLLRTLSGRQKVIIMNGAKYLVKCLS